MITAIIVFFSANKIPFVFVQTFNNFDNIFSFSIVISFYLTEQYFIWGLGQSVVFTRW